MRYYTTTEAAAVLNVDPSRVRLLCKLGRIETIKIGNTYGIAEDVLDQFAARERRPGRPRKVAVPEVVETLGDADCLSSHPSWLPIPSKADLTTNQT
jgi:excisionase family DNA binding protein